MQTRGVVDASMGGNPSFLIGSSSGKDPTILHAVTCGVHAPLSMCINFDSLVPKYTLLRLPR